MQQLLRSLSLFILPVLLIVMPGLASAHVLKEDNGISAVLHMPPDDNPVAGKITELDLAFGDTSNGFSLQNCDCKVTVKQDKQVIYSGAPKPSLAGATLSSRVKVEFSTIGIYDLLVDGSPKGADFKTFHLDYVIRVSSSVNGGPKKLAASGQGGEILVISAGSLAILGLFAYTNMSAGGRYVTEPDPKAKPVRKAARKATKK